MRNALRYSPIDRVLAQPSVLVLRALRHFDDASVAELEIKASSARRALGDHVAAGRAERISHHRYRITDAGRDWLKAQLAKGEIARYAAR